MVAAARKKPLPIMVGKLWRDACQDSSCQHRYERVVNNDKYDENYGWNVIGQEGEDTHRQMKLKLKVPATEGTSTAYFWEKQLTILANFGATQSIYLPVFQ